MFRNPTTDLIIILVVVLLIFGPKRLPGLGRSLGQGMREFKDSIGGRHGGDDEDEERPEITTATSAANETPATAPAPEAKPATEATPAASQPERGSAEIGSSESRS